MQNWFIIVLSGQKWMDTMDHQSLCSTVMLLELGAFRLGQFLYWKTFGICEQNYSPII